jgi:hypothetical protein
MSNYWKFHNVSNLPLTRKVENKHGKNTQKNDPTHNLKDTSKVYSWNKLRLPSQILSFPFWFTWEKATLIKIKQNREWTSISIPK